MNLTRLLLPILILAILSLGLGCSSFRAPKPGEPGSAEVYELAWVHPKIVKADQFITLITSAQLDSFIVAREEAEKGGPPSVVFNIPSDSCQTEAELTSSYGSYKVLLLHEMLASGNYKLSLNVNQFSHQELPPGQYTLRVRACADPHEVRFFRD